MHMMRNSNDNRPIGVFDSGIGGLTVAREIVRQLPGESILYFGDNKRCPYGPRPLDETRSFVRQICSWLMQHDVKLIVIACNTGTAAGLEMAQREFDVPVIGVVEPGARAAVQATRTRRVGVIGTQATIGSGVYTDAMLKLDAGLKIFPAATPGFVEMAEDGWRHARGDADQTIGTVWGGDFTRQLMTDANRETAHGYLDPLCEDDIDTLVLGCTHFPWVSPLIEEVMGEGVSIISSSVETARDVAETLGRRGQLAESGHSPEHRFATTDDEPGDFAMVGSLVFGYAIGNLAHVGIDELEALSS